MRLLAPHPGRSEDRVRILLPFVIISLGLGALAWRSYNLSLRMEQGANGLAEQYAGIASEITAGRVDAAVRAEMSSVADEWQQMERRVDAPNFAMLSTWTSQHKWIVAAIYIPDEDPASTIYQAEVGVPRDQLRYEREFYTSSGTLRYTYDPKLLLLRANQALRESPLVSGSGRPLVRQADVALVYSSRAGIEKLEDGFAFVKPLANPLEDFGVRAIVRTAYVGGKGWQNQRVVSLWVSLMALALMGVGAILALRGMRKEAETMKLRGELIANVSHELRTPLSMIRLGAETLKRGKVKDKERAEIEDQILREVLLLSHLVENVLDVARIQNRSEKALAFTPVRPRDLIRGLVSTYESWIHSKGFDLNVVLDDAVGEQMWDRDAVSRALLNLIDNAIKYSGEADHVIDVVLRQTAEYVVIEVKDHGIGIAPADAAKIFDPYFRAQFSDTITRRGAGLGLTLVQQIVTSHGGRVELDSVLGTGSTFRLLFPRSLATGTPVDVPSMAQAQAF
ncbi:MAG TPA: HAMP domain-containing sensor histidine kinase [Thermoanaerobaculia bacterium]|nr:HAMP domain-containing sensor histidine kinase [Thermoanaerobaculia bacterium]